MEIEHGVLLAAEGTRQHGRYLYHVRDDHVITMTIKVGETKEDGVPPEIDGPLRKEAAKFLASIDDERLDLSDDNPLQRFDRKAFTSLPFEAFALVHPSLTGNGNLKDLNATCWRAFPCYPNEIPDNGDLKWAKEVLKGVSHSMLSRGPMPACKMARYEQSTPERSAKRRRKPVRVRPDSPNMFPARNLVDECLDIENWKGDVIRFAEASVTLLPDGPHHPVAGIAEANTIMSHFITSSELLEPTGQVDVFEDYGRQLEAVGLDVRENGAEPIEVLERGTMRVLVNLEANLIEDVLAIKYDILDPRIPIDDIQKVVDTTVLWALTQNHYQGKAKTVRLIHSADQSTVEYPYPFNKPS